MRTTALSMTCCCLMAAAASRLQSAEAAPAVFSVEETKLCRHLALTNQPWAAPRWEVSLTEARARAMRENKPVFLVVNTGNVLGFV